MHRGEYTLASLRLVFVLLFLWSASAAGASDSDGCSRSNPLVGFSGDLRMIQHQLRGRLTIADDCSFTVSGFDMISGSDQVVWWGSGGEGFQNLTQGFIVSDMRLNRTYLSEELRVSLLQNITWDQVRVLSVWDKLSASNFGHVVLPENSTTKLAESRPPTTFENCVELSPEYRLRWSLAEENSSVDIGLEAVSPETRYMAFGWARPGEEKFFMLKSDVVVAGFKDRDTPFAEDYFISKYSECNWDFQNPAGVCPDFVYNTSASNSSVRLSHGQRLDGVAFIRYTRALRNSDDTELDIPVEPGSEMTVVWALGPLKPPDVLEPFYWPQNHGGPGRVTFGHRKLKLRDAISNCTGPLVAETGDEPVEVIVADRGSPLVVTVDEAAHYPNPPNPTRVFHINKKEAPVLQVERGVPVVFSIQAGHEMAFYVTSDPVGGSTNVNESVYAGGPEAHGVPSHPTPLTWLPNRTTPDEVYYQAFFERKMGWKILVVDGGLSDMYNRSVVLAEQQVTLFWMISGSNISFAVRGETKSGYLGVAFGRGMVNSYAYIGWVGADGSGNVKGYWIDGRDASNIHPSGEELWDKKCSSEKGVVSFEFTRGLQPVCQGGDDRLKICKRNVIDPTVPLKVVWAMGSKWDAGFPSSRNMHDRTSRRTTLVSLEKGAAEAEQEVKPVLIVHGFMMFLAWGVLFPGGIIAARYLKHLENDIWFQAHTYLQYSGVTVMLLAFVFAFAELRGLHTETVHVKLGVLSMVMVCLQPLNAYLRPPKASLGQEPELKRRIWEIVHMYSGRGSLLLGVVTLILGMALLRDVYGDEHLRGAEWALFAWLLIGCSIVGYLELRRHRGKGKLSSSSSGVAWDSSNGMGVHVLDSDGEDDSAELLATGRHYSDGDLLPASTRGMEVQLEAFH